MVNNWMALSFNVKHVAGEIAPTGTNRCNLRSQFVCTGLCDCVVEDLIQEMGVFYAYIEFVFVTLLERWINTHVNEKFWVWDEFLQDQQGF